MELFAHFLNRLRQTPDNDGTLLDHSLIVYGCGISDSNSHLHNNLPVFVAGGGLTGNRHLRVARDTPVTNLYLSLLDRMDVHVDKLGDSTGKLDV